MRRQIIATLTFVSLAVGVVILAAAGSNSLLGMSLVRAESICNKTGFTHTAVIQNDKIQPEQITARRCDILKIENRDKVVREIGFGAHEQHEVYNGIAEEILTPNKNFTVTLNKTGTYYFHDHFHQEISGSFSVR